jgi:hypothetical protein
MFIFLGKGSVNSVEGMRMGCQTVPIVMPFG